MELKIKIKEVEEETRDMIVEERCMYITAHDPNYTDSFRKDIENRLDDIGFIELVTPSGVKGLFRKETIRDATPEEYRAWVYLQLIKHCVEIRMRSSDCQDCFMHGVCIATDFKTTKARSILKGKEVILELV